MSVYQSPKSPYWQYDFQFQGRRFHGSTGCEGKRAAEAYEAKQRRIATLGESVKPSITMDVAGQLWWEAKGKHHKSHKTTEYQLANLITGLGKGKLLGDMAFMDWQKYVSRRRAAVSDTSVNRELEIARAMFRYLAESYDVAPVTWGKLIMREPKGRVRELSEEEESNLFSKLSVDLAAVVEFALLSGQRRTAVITLLWSKVDLGGSRASVLLKGGNWHSFPLTPRMVEIIKGRPKVSPQVFTYQCERTAPKRGDRAARIKGGRYPFSKQGWTRKWRKALEEAGVEDFRFHDLRHTRGTRLLRATGNLKVVQKLLGHTDIATTARYAHALEDDVRTAMLAGESRNSPGTETVRDAETPGNLRKTG